MAPTRFHHRTAPNAAGHCRAYVGASTLAPIGSGSSAEASPFLLTSTQRHYFARSTSNSLRHWWWTSGGSVQRDTWGEGISGSSVAFIYGTQQHTFARTTLGGLAHAFWDSKDGIRRSDTWATGLASAPAAMVIGDAQHVWAVDTAGNLQQSAAGPAPWPEAACCAHPRARTPAAVSPTPTPRGWG